MTVVFVVVLDDAYQLDPQPPVVFAQPHQAEQHARHQVGAGATRAVIAPDHVQYLNASGDLFISIHEVRVQRA